MSKEVRLVSETGAEKGQKPSQLGSIDPLALMYLGEVAGYGARKYATFNYLKGYDWKLCVDAMLRHLLLFWSGEDRDECPMDCDAERFEDGVCKEHSGLLHVAHAAWHGLALTSFLLRDLGEDTRFRQEVEDVLRDILLPRVTN